MASIALVSALWCFGSEEPTGEAIRAGSVSLQDLTLPDLKLQAPSWSLLDPLRSEMFRLTSIDFAGLETLGADELTAQVGLEPIALIDVDPHAVCSRLRTVQPRVATCQAALIPPRTLMVKVQERHPIAVVMATGVGVDTSGVSFPLGPDEGAQLPRISGDLPASLAVLIEANRRGIATRTVHAERPDDIVIELAAGPIPSLRIGADAALGMELWQRTVRTWSAAELRDNQLDTRFSRKPFLRPLGAAQDQNALELGGE
jgi:hypothetical protein